MKNKDKDIQKITNVKLGKSNEKENNKWLEAKSKKITLLSLTDWTQLPDMQNLDNKEKFAHWREGLRKVDLKSEFDDPSQALEFLYEYQKRMPKPEFSKRTVREDNTGGKDEIEKLKDLIYNEIQRQLPNFKKCDSDNNSLNDRVDRLENKIKTLNEKLVNFMESFEKKTKYIKKEEAIQIIKKEIENKRKNDAISAGALEYPLIKERIEQAADYLSDDNTNISDYSLLENENDNISDDEYAKSLLNYGKKYFKKLASLEKKYLHDISSVYNMSPKELTERLQYYGYRYRCKP